FGSRSIVKGPRAEPGCIMNTVATSITGNSAEAKRQLLAARLRKAAAEGPTMPLSFAQQRLWFLDQLEPNSALYNMPSLLRLTGTLDPGALQRALDSIVRRHEALRTHFICLNENPLQIVDRNMSIKIQLQDLSG